MRFLLENVTATQTKKAARSDRATGPAAAPGFCLIVSNAPRAPWRGLAP